MSVPYLEYLETQPARPSQAALERLAAALQTAPERLLGVGTGQPPGRAGPSGHPVLQTLTAAECYDLLSPGGVGRVAFTTADGPVVLPVNYAMAGQTVIFRTAPDWVNRLRCRCPVSGIRRLRVKNRLVGLPRAGVRGGSWEEATVEEHFVWMTTRQLEPGTLAEFERAWRPDTHPEGMLRAYAYWSADEREIIGVSFWASRELCEAWRSSGSEARRREAMAAYVVGEQERFYRGRELHVPDR